MTVVVRRLPHEQTVHFCIWISEKRLVLYGAFASRPVVTSTIDSSWLWWQLVATTSNRGSYYVVTLLVVVVTVVMAAVVALQKKKYFSLTIKKIANSWKDIGVTITKVSANIGKKVHDSCFLLTFEKKNVNESLVTYVYQMSKKMISMTFPLECRCNLYGFL